jgi:muramoyltetrapeptide carboxypeptidase
MHIPETQSFGAVKPLGVNSRVALVAPSGIVADPSQMDRAEENTRSFGWIPVMGANVSRLHGYLAGTDKERAEDFNHALRDDSIDAIWCVRGGYGAARLLPHIDFDALRANPRPVIGFSDITALHAAIHRKCGIVSYHGPTARGEMSDFSRDSFERAIIRQTDSCGVASEARPLRGGKARGRLAGGNLALVASLMGTPWSVDFDGAILVLEDIDEAVYRVDRMLRQLLLSGELSKCAALVTGDFRPPEGESAENNRLIDEVIFEAADEAGIPCLAGVPVGHIADQWTLPLGAMAEVDIGERRLRIVSSS